MFPVLFQKGLITIHTYGVMLAIGFSLGFFLSSRHAESHGLSKKYVQDFVYGLVVSGLFGARFFYVLQDWDYFRRHLVEIFYVHCGGLVLYGSFFSALLFLFLFFFKRSSDPSHLLNFIIPYIPLGQFFGRCGCFFNGCCHGQFGRGFVHPVQLYEAFACLFLSLLLFRLRSYAFQPKGYLVGLYCFVYATFRFFLEFLRGDPVPQWHGLRISQWISLCILMCLMAYGILILWKKKMSKKILLSTV